MFEGSSDGVALFILQELDARKTSLEVHPDNEVFVSPDGQVERAAYIRDDDVPDLYWNLI
jgi:hypothetical protein